MKLAPRLAEYGYKEKKVRAKKGLPPKQGRYRPGVRALKEIHYYQKQMDLLIPHKNMWE